MKQDKTKKIMGKNSTYNKSSIVRLYKSLIKFHGGMIIDDLERLRDLYKRALAKSIEKILIVNNRIKENWVEIDNVSKEIIAAHFSAQNSIVASFISCLIRYYNTAKDYSVDINLDDPSLKSRKLNKAFTHVRKNTELCYNRYIKTIKDNLESLSKGDKTYIEAHKKYVSIEWASVFFLDYIENLYAGFLPKDIAENTFSDACQYDTNGRLNELYERGLDSNYHLKKNKRYKYLSLTIPCATVILCSICKSKSF